MLLGERNAYFSLSWQPRLGFSDLAADRLNSSFSNLYNEVLRSSSNSHNFNCMLGKVSLSCFYPGIPLKKLIFKIHVIHQGHSFHLGSAHVGEVPSSLWMVIRMTRTLHYNISCIITLGIKGWKGVVILADVDEADVDENCWRVF